MNEYFKRFANCIPVKGINRSSLIDIQRKKYYLVPNDMLDLLEYFDAKKTKRQALEAFGHENGEAIAGYMDFLLNNELGFLTTEDEFDLFPPLDLTFEYPAPLTNAILEITPETLGYSAELFRQLSELRCKNIQLVAYAELSCEDLTSLLASCAGLDFRSIELVVRFSDKYSDDFLSSLDAQNFSIVKMVLHSSENEMYFAYGEKAHFPIQFIKAKVCDFKCCGVVSSTYFDVNLPKVLEAISYNSCLNKKVAIDGSGIIRNCPAMPEGFGHVSEVSLKDAIGSDAFRTNWDITKDHIDGCKDCEFRYVCTDCRAFVDEPGNPVSKPLKCGYDPYTNQWEQWSQNPLKHQAVQFYGLPIAKGEHA